MQLVFLHGPPAAGKFTIATEVAARTGWGVFHNHLTLDLARPFFPFGSEPFWALVRELRLAALRAAAERGAGTVLYTSCYDHPVDLGFYEEIEAILAASGGAVIPVYLQCDVAELERRVTGESRVAMGKVRTVEGLHAQLCRWNCVAIPRDGTLRVVTDGKTAPQCAEEIIERLRLGR
ncbi:MAG TPA: hypothetical protein VEX86_16010 [Longimicrobium sp.]|nr:hypothetical protein [Longimicrobium sp.]